MNHKLIISIAGQAGSGKSAVATAISRALRQHGMQVKINDLDEEFELVDQLPTILDMLAARGTQVDINVVQLNKFADAEQVKAGKHLLANSTYGSTGQYPSNTFEIVTMYPGGITGIHDDVVVSRAIALEMAGRGIEFEGVDRAYGVVGSLTLAVSDLMNQSEVYYPAPKAKTLLGALPGNYVYRHSPTMWGVGVGHVAALASTVADAAAGLLINRHDLQQEYTSRHTEGEPISPPSDGVMNVTIEHLVPGVSANVAEVFLSHLLRDKFSEAVDADLVIYTDPNGARKVLKDRSGQHINAESQGLPL